MTDDKKLLKKKRIVAVFSIAVVIVLVALLTCFVGTKFKEIASSGAQFRDYIRSFGSFGFLVAIGLQILQVIVALIPGEVVEIGMGYAYGWFWGTFFCLIGVAAGSSINFMLAKKFGIRFVEIFVSADKINELRFINSETKLRRVTFILYLIPGTPKDLLTYFIGLTRMTPGEFLTLTMVARIPSLISSTIGGSFISEGRYVVAGIIFILTAVISVIGINFYKVIISKLKEKVEKNKYLSKIKHFRDTDK